MMEKREIIFENIVENISDGILTIGLDGRILLANASATSILGIEKDRLVGQKLAKLLMENDENDDFFQCLMDAVYSKQTIVQMVPFFSEGEEKRLRVVSSFLTNGKKRVGLIVTFSDLTTMVRLNERNEALTKTLAEFLDRFVEVMIGAIEARTPYNANHTKSMVHYAENYLNWLRQKGREDLEDIQKPFLASVWLHDIGKLVVPRSIMDKATRLGSREGDVFHRIDIAVLCERLRMAKDPSLEAEASERIQALTEAKTWIDEVNHAGMLSGELGEKLEKIKKLRCLTADGEEIPLLKEEELLALSIRRGTLTPDERSIVQSHVVRTREMIGQMGFSGEYENVSSWAGGHHELLDGSGYPLGLKGEEIPWETRLLTILDVYDSLTADDRPYKPAMPPEKAFRILGEMSGQGKLDGELLKSFYESNAWKA
ncbi:MAG: PAS domain S-box protein [Lachnospiraceae bacterium]|nr:PAS domain S-box protein [Lachnospiraceae bacterium]